MKEGTIGFVEVLGKKIEIVVWDDLSLEGDSCDGMFSPDEARIYINSAVKPENVNRVLLHEMVHAVHARSGITSTSVSPDILEILCETTAIAIAENFEMKLL